VSGISTFGGDVQVPDKIIHTGDTNTAIRFPAADTVSVETGGSERLRVDSSGNMGLGGAPIAPGHLTFHINNSTSSAATRFHMTTNGTGATASDGFSLSIDGSSGDTNLIQRESANMVFYTAGSERLRIGSAGQLGIAGANYGTSGQVLSSQGSGSAFQWATPSNPTLSHAFCFMDSQYFTSSVTLLEFNTSTTNDRSSGVTIDRTNHRFTPTVAGLYQVQANLQFSHGGATYSPTLYIYRNGSSYVVSYNIVNYSGGHYDSIFAQAMITMNGSSDYVDMRASHNGGGNATMMNQSTFTMFRISA